MTLYHSRYQAGARLAAELPEYYRGKDVLVLGIARGGLETAAGVADELHVPLDVVVVKKIGLPFDSERALGAIDELRHPVWDNHLIEVHKIPLSYLEESSLEKGLEAQKMASIYREGRSLSSCNYARVIVVDDGIATGLTMKVAVALVRRLGAKEVVVATPVGARGALEKLKGEADKVVSLYVPRFFTAVANYYHEFPQCTDEQVKNLLIQHTYTV